MIAMTNDITIRTTRTDCIQIQVGDMSYMMARATPCRGATLSAEGRAACG